MKWLTTKSRDAVRALIGDFAKITFAGYFAGEFFYKLTPAQKCIFWGIFAFFVMLFFILTIEEEQR